jgi:hypothetical protein
MSICDGKNKEAQKGGGIAFSDTLDDILALITTRDQLFKVSITKESTQKRCIAQDLYVVTWLRLEDARGKY